MNGVPRAQLRHRTERGSNDRTPPTALAVQMANRMHGVRQISRRCLLCEKIGYTALMSEPTDSETTVANIGVAMFSVADQDAALKFYTEKLGYEVRADVRFGENNEMRWLEVAPPGSTARLALNPPMGGQPGGGAIGVETTDVLAEHKRLGALGVDVDTEPMRTPGAPLMFMMRDPDGNSIAVVEDLAP